MGYETVARLLGMDSQVVECVAGRLRFPLIEYVSPAQWYVFPPALIPIASNGSGPRYLGIWSHWFTDRQPSFVQMSIENGRTVSEIAKTSEQLFTFVAMKAIVENDGLTPEIRAFAQQAGLNGLDQLDQFSLQTGDDLTKFSVIPVFSDQIPLAVCANRAAYRGSFPIDVADAFRKVATTSPFELNKSNRPQLAQARVAPWFNDDDRVTAFDQLLVRREFSGAWLVLNSPGWTVSSARDAIVRLADAVGLPAFRELANAWRDVAMGPDLTY
jgi:hypothetical protein